MRLIPPPVNISPKEGFTEENDIFGYKQFGENMMNRVAASSASQFVMLLDGSWGTGKSVFVKQWAGLLRRNDFPVIEFDAFRNDYQEDAFIAFAGEVYDLGKEELGAEQAPVSGFLDKAKKAGVVLAPALVKAGIRAATAGLINTENMGEAAQVFTNAMSDDGSEAVEKIISKRLENRNSERNALDSFSASLSEIAAALGKGREDRPLVIIVDELDRCKPTFALNILERIKHLFSTENVVFVLAADFEQLKNVVAGAYGGGNFDGAKYLEKFFHVRATLPKIGSDGRRGNYAAYIWSKMEITSDNPDLSNNLRAILVEASRGNRLSLRNVERIATNVALAVQAFPNLHPELSYIYFGLCLLRYANPKAFDDALSGVITLEDVFECAQCDDWEENDSHWFKQTWIALLKPDSDELTGKRDDYFRMVNLSRGPGENDVRDLARKIASFHIEPPREPAR